MNATRKKQIIAMFLVTFAGSTYAYQPEPPVAVKTDGMPPHVAAKVKEKAAEGPTALRRYVDNTRLVNALDFRSILRNESVPNLALNAKTEEPVKVAAVEGHKR